jgi:hypothetical protein
VTTRSVLLASNYNVWREPFNGQSYSFLSVISEVENAAILAPPGVSYLAGHAVRPNLGYLMGEAYYRIVSQVRHRLGLASLSNMATATVDKNYDMFFFCCQFPQELACLDRISGWRERSGTAVCYLLETWSSSLASSRTNLRLLDKFDHVFVLNAASVPLLQEYTSTPISHLAPATDCAMARPLTVRSERSIDVYSFGRRSAPVHEQLVRRAARSSDFLYVYDTISGGTVANWREHRQLTASMMKNSRYFIAFNPSDVGGGAKGAYLGEQALSTRYFESIAGGAVMLGTVPDCAEFAQNIDWPDAVIELQPDGDVCALLDELDSQPERMEALRKRNVAESLARHDWSHRWRSVLTHLGLPLSEALGARIEALQAMAGLLV